MADPADDLDLQGGLSEQEKRDNVIRLAFGGRQDEFEKFCRLLADFAPPGTTGILRGSAITGHRWKDEAPFDADGPGTSDLDVTLVGSKVMEYWDKDAYYIPGLHTKPLCDDDPAIAIGLDKLRKALQQLVGRPVNFQATANLVLYARDVLFNEPYFTLIEAEAGS